MENVSLKTYLWLTISTRRMSIVIVFMRCKIAAMKLLLRLYNYL